MTTQWEYIRASGSAREQNFDPKEAHIREVNEIMKQAAQAWEDRLNELGTEGWELVSERLSYGDPHRFGGAQAFWAEYSGTLKRPRAD